MKVFFFESIIATLALRGLYAISEKPTEKERLVKWCSSCQVFFMKRESCFTQILCPITVVIR